MGMLSANHESAVKDLLIIDSVRGPHSVGLASVTNQGHVKLRKAAMLPQQFLSQKEVQELFYGVNRVMIGHNRFATQGAVNDVNAHPYMFKNIIGAHNGTLRNQKLLPDHDRFEVDSQVLLNAIDTLGTEVVDQKIHGAFALTWYNKANNTLHMWRNEDRPLWYCITEDEKVMFWASEPMMLGLALSRRGIKYKAPQELPVHKEYIFPVNMGFNETLKEPTILDRKHYVAPVTTYNNSGRYGKWSGNSYGYNDSRYSGGWNDFEDGCSDDYAGWNKKDLPGVAKKEEPVKKSLPLLLSHTREGEASDLNMQTQISNQVRQYALKLKRLEEVLLAESSSTTAISTVYTSSSSMYLKA